jgi:hypothetical protein
MNSYNKKSKSPIILFESIDWRVTLREALFSIFLFGVLMLIGSLISGYIKSYVHNKHLVYKQAMQIRNNPDEFKWAMATDVGHVFVEGQLKSVGTVTHPKLNIDVTEYSAVYQHYNMHTRPVTRTRSDGKGRSHTYTTIETYWTWDTYKRKHDSVTNVVFSGVEFDYKKFILDDFYKSKTVENGHRDRIVFNYILSELHGSLFGEIKHKTLDGKIKLSDVSLDNLYKHYTTSILNTVFWIFWSIMSVVLIILFYLFENKWLEDSN